MRANFNTNTAAVTDKFIVDYKNADGQDYHQCFAIFGVPNNSYSEYERRKSLAEYLRHMLIFQGCKPTRIVFADCDLSVDELQDLTDGKLPPKGYAGVIELYKLYNSEI